MLPMKAACTIFVLTLLMANPQSSSATDRLQPNSDGGRMQLAQKERAPTHDQQVPTHTQTTVWKPAPLPNGREYAWLRDPSIYYHQPNSYIMSGTRPFIVEFPGITPAELQSHKGRWYKLIIWSPNGKRRLRRDGFNEWGKSFTLTRKGVVMLASLPAAIDFDYDNRAKTNKRRRSVFLFEPMNKGRTTARGFPLDWRMKSNSPFLQGIYSARLFEIQHKKYLLSDRRHDAGIKATCISILELDTELDKGSPQNLLCPGQQTGPAQWSREQPYLSEIRFEDGGGLVEGAWMHRSSAGQYYILYSSGDYAASRNYGGFVATCKDVMGPCRKILDHKTGRVRVFLSGSSRDYERVGRPYPVVDSRGQLVNIIFHARIRQTNRDAIISCANFTPTIIEDFIAGGPGCEY